MPEHGVAVTTGTAGDDLTRPDIFVMCECGWHATFPNVVTFDYIAELVEGHRDAAA